MKSGCLFCGGDATEPNHLAHCDGKQGRIEADLPPLISGLTPETWNTSAAAAAAIEENRETQRWRVFHAIRRAGRNGCTDDEIQAALGIHSQSECPRRLELWRLNLITILQDADGKAVRRPTRRRRRAVVWVAK